MDVGRKVNTDDGNTIRHGYTSIVMLTLAVTVTPARAFLDCQMPQASRGRNFQTTGHSCFGSHVTLTSELTINCELKMAMGVEQTIYNGVEAHEFAIVHVEPAELPRARLDA